MFQGEFREREKGQAPDVIDRGDRDDYFSCLFFIFEFILDSF